jgi:hypothetical protein
MYEIWYTLVRFLRLLVSAASLVRPPSKSPLLRLRPHFGCNDTNSLHVIHLIFRTDTEDVRNPPEPSTLIDEHNRRPTHVLPHSCMTNATSYRKRESSAKTLSPLLPRSCFDQVSQNISVSVMAVFSSSAMAFASKYGPL